MVLITKRYDTNYTHSFEATNMITEGMIMKNSETNNALSSKDENTIS